MKPPSRKDARVMLDQKLCSGCGCCIETCLKNVFSFDPSTKKARILNIDLCTGCKECISVCIEMAIDITY